MDKFSSWLQTYHHLLAIHPLESGSYLALATVVVIIGLLSLATGRAWLAFWITITVILASLAFFQGDDLEHHIYRVVELARQIAAGKPDLLLVDPRTGEALPTFVYYSFLPYLPAVALDFLGFPAHAAVKLELAVLLLILFVGLQRLVDRVFEPRGRAAGFLAAILFVTATYVYRLWLTRMALSEIWVYSLLPWTTVALLNPVSVRALAVLFFLQAAGHPIVFPPALACTLLVGIGLSSESPATLLKRCFFPLLVAVVVASPFWLPQALWKDAILGVHVLPQNFANTFFDGPSLLSPLNIRTIGLFLPLGALIALLSAGVRASWRGWLLFLVFAFSLALQSIYLRPVALLIPTLPYSLFVWRLMLPAAFLGFGALIATMRSSSPGSGPIAALAALSIVTMVAAQLGPAQIYLQRDPPASGDNAWYSFYLDRESVWGRNEYLPNYAGLSSNDCASTTDAGVTTWQQIHAGLTAKTAYLRIPFAPVDIVAYTADGQTLEPKACGNDLLLGPLQSGALVRSSEGRLQVLLWARVAALLLALGGVWMIRPARRRRLLLA